jgi:hypothetical protein
MTALTSGWPRKTTLVALMLVFTFGTPGLFWAGTDDGRIHITRDDCKTWEEITPAEMPEWTQISIIEPSPHDPATAYIAAMRYKFGGHEYRPSEDVAPTDEL